MNWQKQGEKMLYKGWRSMIAKTFRLPDGKVVDYDIVANGDYVTIAAFTPDREAILVKQFRPGPEMEMVSFPEGYIDAKETFLEAASRELEEETGYRAAKMIHLKTIRSAYNTERQYCVLALDCVSTSVPKLDATEFIESFLCPLPDFKHILKKTDRQDFANIASAYMALDYLGW